MRRGCVTAAVVARAGEECSWADLDGIGFALVLNCGPCDGPCDPCQPRCRECVDRRSGRAFEAHTAYMGEERGLGAEILCRIYGNR